MANLSQLKREKMLAFLEKLKEQHTDDESLIALGEIEKELKSKKYGLVWEEHEEAVDVQMKTQIPVFTEVKEREICADENGAYNFLLEGDNLHSLYLLEKTHKGKIDVIAIDVPYNTGNKDFIYDDSYVVKEDGYHHSKWLSFMKKRLEIAQKLLSENGVIFINIDDIEHAQLKLLCDEIFGETNFISSIPWHNRTSMQNDTDISVNHEYILAYAKYRRPDNRRLKDSNRSKWKALKGFTFIPKEVDKSKFSNPDNDPRGLWKADPFDAPNIRPNLTYPITNPVTGEQHLPPKGRHWRISPEKFASALADNRIIFGKNGKGRPQMKIFYNEVSYKGAVPDSWFDAHIFGTSTQGKKELLNILSDAEQVFSTPKPTQLYIELLKMSSFKNATILDFFAGSGTTGHAVMELNKQDGGHRKFILCNNNENKICEEMTYQRLKTVITGKRADGSEYSEGIPANLKYFKTDFVDKDSEDLSDELLNHIKEMIELEHGIKVDNQRYVIILTDEDMDKFEQDIDKYANLKAVFVNQDILLTSTQQKLLDSINSYIIPDYYFDFELREAGELW